MNDLDPQINLAKTADFGFSQTILACCLTVYASLGGSGSFDRSCTTPVLSSCSIQTGLLALLAALPASVKALQQIQMLQQEWSLKVALL